MFLEIVAAGLPHPFVPCDVDHQETWVTELRVFERGGQKTNQQRGFEYDARTRRKTRTIIDDDRVSSKREVNGFGINKRVLTLKVTLEYRDRLTFDRGSGNRNLSDWLRFSDSMRLSRSLMARSRLSLRAARSPILLASLTWASTSSIDLSTYPSCR